MTNYNDGVGAIIDADASSYDPPQLPTQNPPDRKLSLVSADLYSYHRFAQGAFAIADYPVFLTPIGQIGQGFAIALTELHTNIRVSGLLPGGVAWRIQKVGVEFAPGNDPDDVINFCRHTFLDFIRGSTSPALPRITRSA